MYYSFQQQGDFIDFATFKVFPDHFESDGWAPTVHTFVGTDVSLNPRFAVTVEGRYEWAHKQLELRLRAFPADRSVGFRADRRFCRSGTDHEQRQLLATRVVRRRARPLLA